MASVIFELLRIHRRCEFVVAAAYGDETLLEWPLPYIRMSRFSRIAPCSSSFSPPTELEDSVSGIHPTHCRFREPTEGGVFASDWRPLRCNGILRSDFPFFSAVPHPNVKPGQDLKGYR